MRYDMANAKSLLCAIRPEHVLTEYSQSANHRTDLFYISARYCKRHWTDIVLPISIKSDRYIVRYISVQYRTDITLANYTTSDRHWFPYLISDYYYFLKICVLQNVA